MTKEHTHPEQNDWQAPGGEQLLPSENLTEPVTTDASQSAEQSKPFDDQPDTTPAEVQMDIAPSAPDSPRSAHQSETAPTPASEQTEAPREQPSQEAVAVVEEAFSRISEVFASEQPGPLESEALPIFPLEKVSMSEEEAVRPFTDFIEEFRQSEFRLQALLHDQEKVLPTSSPETSETIVPLVEDGEEAVAQAETASEQSPAPALEGQPGLTQPSFAPDRPVSPLLRPATRQRVPRHGRQHRVEEHSKVAETPATPAKSEEIEQAIIGESASAALEVPAVAEPEARPARRYRFDRPSATASTSPSLSKPASPATAPSAPSTESREKPGRAEKIHVVITPEKNGSLEVEAVEAQPPVSSTHERRKRGSHDRQREKEQIAPPTPSPVAEVAASEPESAPAPEVPVEDLPPLEYSELQAASSRRRRRRRVGNGVTAPTSKIAPPEHPQPAQPTSALALPRSAPTMPVAPNYNIVSGYTVSQMNQGNGSTGPFMGPEPSPARGSTFTTPTTPQVRHLRGEALRSTTTHVTKHGETSLMSATSVNHLGQVIAQSIQLQTDRMIAELRRANQVPTNVSVSLPPFPSTERVGVFVDVANLLYSARTLRMTVDFGKLLDFLRGNRRLVRAQAYCPTSPQPGDDQMFLQAVKGLGYRITTKNYKTFSSGAKKADLDLDLCMDVVRLVDGKAVDCIVLVSGDSDFMPMLDYCSDHGVRVEVAAFDESMSATLRQGCDLFVNLSMLEEIRA